MAFFGLISKDKSSSKSATKAATDSFIPTTSYIAQGTPVYRNLSELSYLLKCYCENPIVQATINIKGKAFSNMRFFVKVIKNDEIIPIAKYDADKGKLKKLLSQPNPLQSTYEWLIQNKINREVFGNTYAYASVPVGFEKKFTYRDINVINNLAPYCMAPVLTGRWLDATDKEEIIQRYDFTGFNGRVREFKTNTIFHLNYPNIKLNQNFTQGESLLPALKQPISNIDSAYESRNVLIRKRGALGILTSEKRDEAMGNVPLNEGEIKDVHDAFKKYGLLDDQYSQIISPHPLKYTKMAQSVKELMLFEEVESDAVAVSTAFGVPELLVKYYIKGGTFANLDASEKRLYDSTIIPETEEFMVGLNNFLGTQEHGIQLIATYDHLNILQTNKKDAADTMKLKEQTFMNAFKIGSITYNVYLNAIGLPPDSLIGEKRVWDLTEVQLRAIGIINSNSIQNGKQE